MTEGLRHERHVPALIVMIACAVIVLAGLVGAIAYAKHAEDTADTRVRLAREQVLLAKDLATIADQVCRRQDQVIAALLETVRALDEAFTQEVPGAVQPQVTAEALARLERVRAKTRLIEKSPCNGRVP